MKPERKSILKVIGILSAIYLILLGIFWVWLANYTGHGEYISVPDLKDLTIEEAQSRIDQLGLTSIVIDSIYSQDGKAGTVIQQSPLPESKVKSGRQIYLTIFRKTPPGEKLGISVGEFHTAALIKLRNKGFEYDTVYEHNNLFPGSIVRITSRGRQIGPEDILPRGSKVLVTIGKYSEQEVIIPDLTGMNCKEAEALLTNLNLQCNCRFESINEKPTSADSLEYKTCRQDPIHHPVITSKAGRIVDLWLYNTPCPQDSTISP
jgi:beta-lactam-binding protein with PASTA domain